MENLNESAENEGSDSGDSLFLTQKPIPHPVRSTSLPHLSQRSTPISPRLLESTSSSESEPEDVSKKGKKSPCLPRYNFPFLKSRKSQLPEDGLLPVAQNRAIHYYGIAGFFRCVEHENKGPSFESTLPTVDSGNEEITPITEDEMSDEEDVKIIDKKLFVYSLKPIITKNSQPWFRSLKNIVSQCSQEKESTPLGYISKKHKSQSTSKKSKSLTKSHEKPLESSDSDMTLIEDDELSISRSKNAITTKKYICTPESSVNSTKIWPSVNQGLDLSALEESDNAESQSILQYNPIDIRGSRQDNVYSENILHQSTRKKHKNKTIDGDNENQDTMLSQESLHLLNNLNTNHLKNKTMSKNDKTKKKNGAERLHDVNYDLETTLTEPLPVATSTQQEVIGQSINEYTGLPSWPDVEDLSDDDVALQKNHKTKLKKKTCDVENTEKGRNILNVDPLDMLDSGQMVTVSAVENEASDISDGKRKKLKKSKKTELDNCSDEQEAALEKNKNILSKCVGNRENSEVFNSATYFTATQSDESVSLRKKKRKVSTAAETVEKADLPLLQNSKQSHEPDKVGISSKDIDSAEINSYKTSRKTHKNRSKTKNKESAETLHDVETTIVTEPISVSSNSEKEVNRQSIHKDTGQPSCPNIEDVNDDAALQKKKKKLKKKTAGLKNAENENNNLTSDSLQLFGQMDNFAVVENEVLTVSGGKRKKHKKKRKADPGDCDDEQDVTLEKLQLNNTGNDILSKSVQNQGKSELVDDSATDFTATQSDESVSVRKKKKKLPYFADTVENANVLFSQSKNGADELDFSTNDVESAEINNVDATILKKKKKTQKKKTVVENETSSWKLHSLEKLHNRQTDNTGKRKKKKRKTDHGDCNDEQDVALENLQLKNMNKNSLSKFVESQGESELVDSSTTDFTATQYDESILSVKKKKRKVSSAAEIVENVNFPLSWSHGADDLSISTKDVESAESNRLLQDTELENKIKKKKRRKDDEPDHLDTNDKASEATGVSGFKKRTDFESTEVARTRIGEDDRVKKKKIKSNRESHSSDIEMTTQRHTSEVVEESAILSLKSSKRKKKKSRDDGEGLVVETAEETEKEQTTIKRKKKNRIKDVDQKISTLAHGEMSSPAGKSETNSRTKVKKRLYNPSSETFLE